MARKECEMASSSAPAPISEEERWLRLSRLRQTMAEKAIDAFLLGSTESLRYITGLVWHSSERFLGAVVTASELVYIVPAFERSRVESLRHLPGDIRVWQEEENSAALAVSLIPSKASLAVDDA